MRMSRSPLLPLLAAVFGLAAPAAAQEKPVLTVYTYDSFAAEWGPGPKIEAAFEETCACDLNFVGLADGVAILNRLRLEGATSPADLALGMTTDMVPEMKASGLFAPSGVDVSKTVVPGNFRDDTFVPFDYSYLAVMVDTQSGAAVPTSFDDLVNGDPSQKIAIQDPRSSTPGLGLMLWMKAVYGDEAAAKWKQLSNRILTVTPGWSESYNLFTKGEVPLVLSYTTSEAYHVIEEGTDRYKAAAFAEGQYVQVEVAGRLTGSKNPELAARFLAFILTPEFQNVIPTTNWAYPVIADAAPLPEAFAALPKVEKPLAIDPETVAANREAWTAEWLAAIGR
ncbi:thiamine ABC transporter substrate binding subunit [Jeongeupella avenae]|uniref:Thiamine ABC transporter substrate binding subunit n=2 Tax=Antarcticirhabdus aurantiaca TaxID=2606717 RepID=A0ACD4NLD7_9HYPH|nr:thiamine ABC transporter substrate binding subunit [Antarcticirhabdus aurantiaca]WAJ27663.1 thiamine ABC transporter substrate binding subunit [Jeongeuplla avenae]